MWTILTDREHSSLLQQEVVDALPNYLLKPHTDYVTTVYLMNYGRTL